MGHNRGSFGPGILPYLEDGKSIAGERICALKTTC
jgi:hypothetical protein